MKYQLLSEVSTKALSSCLWLLCFFMTVSSLQAQNLVYAKGLPNVLPLAGTVLSRSIQVDKLGNTYVTGNFTGTADFDPGVDTANLTSAGSNEIFIAKYNASGGYVFAKSIAGTGSDDGYGIAIDRMNNIYVTGYFVGTADFDPGAGIANLNSAGSYDIFVAKYDSSGKYIYAKSVGGSNNDFGYGIAVDSSGNVHVTGSFTGTVDVDPGPGVILTNSEGSTDFFVAKYDSAGNYIYNRAFGSTGIDAGYGIAVDRLGNVYVTGNFTGTVDFDPGAGFEYRTSAGNLDIFVARYDTSGNYLYALAMGGRGIDVANGIAVDIIGYAYITGSFVDTADFDPGSGSVILNGDGSNDIFVARYDPNGIYSYAKAIGGTSNDIGNSIAVDVAGNASVTGYFNMTADFDPDIGSIANLVSAGGNDVFVARYDIFGNYVYAKRLGGIFSDEGYGIAVDNSGNTYTTGSFRGTADFDPGAAIENLSIAGTGTNAFVLRLDSPGNYVWARKLGSYPNVVLSDAGRSVVVDALGNTYIAGYFYGTVDFDPGTGAANLTSAGANDIFLAKYDASGNYIYAKAMGSFSADAAYGIAVDGSGSVYLTGSFAGTVDFDPGPGIGNLTSILGNEDIFLASYDASGNYVYAKALGGENYEQGSSIVADGSGNVYITGFFAGTADFDPGPGIANLVSVPGSFDIFVAKYAAGGNYVYARAIGGANLDNGNDVAVDGFGNAYITGFFDGTVDFDPSPGIANLTSAGMEDIFMAKYDALGNYVYAKAIGGNGMDLGSGIAVDGSGNAYVTGSFSATADFDPGTATTTLTSAGRLDIFLARYDASGNYVYAKASGGKDNDYGNNVALDGSNNTYINGYFSDTADFNPGPGIDSRISAGSFDIFIAKYDASGNYVSAKAIGGTNGDYGYGIAVDGSGNLHITGSFAETVDFNPGGNTPNSMITASNGDDIYFARYSQSGGLPVELISFDAKAVRGGDAVQVNWSTASEANNAFFEVERSINGVQFTTVGRRPGCNTCPGSQQYELFDNNPYTGLSYYRLRQVDLDLTFFYSPTVVVNISSGANTSVRVYPNITTGACELMINTLDKKQVVVRLLDAGGRLVKQQQVWLNAGNNRFDYSLSDQAKGVYYFSVTDNQGKISITVRVIKK
ncbi:MAG: SBBP repeat-containing protein [Chitinophagaceae bacterium]